MKLKIISRFGITPNELLNNEEITMKAKGLFAFIQSKPDSWNFSAKRISQQTKDGGDGISSGLKELEEYGYLTRNKYQDKKGQWQWEYVLTDKPVQENPGLDKPVQENTLNISKKELVKKNSNKEVGLISFFDVFWGEYPVKRSKTKAMEKFNKLSKEMQLMIIEDVKKRKKEDSQWAKGFIPHPTTYLNQERWEDEMSPEVKNSQSKILMAS